MEDNMGLFRSLINALSGEISASLSPAPTPEECQSMVNGFLYGYGESFHCTNEQYFRFQRSMNPEKMGRIVSMDKQRMRMQITGSYHPEQIYNVHLNHCNCNDFKERHLPCKHIYRLALELGIVTPQWDLSGLTPEVHDKLFSLSTPQEKALLRLINKQGAKATEFDTGKGTVPVALVKAGLIDEVSRERILDKNFKKQDLLAMLSVSDGCPVSHKDKKEDVIKYIAENEPKLAKVMSEKFYRVKYSEILFKNLEFIHRYLSQKYEQ